MKYISLIVALIILLGCAKDNPTAPVSQIDLLPLPTHVGANKAGCLIDGVAMISGNFSQGTGMNCYYDNETFTFGFSENESGLLRTVLVSTHNIPVHTLLNIPIDLHLYSDSTNYGRYATYEPIVFYDTNSEFVGQVTITHYDYDNAYLSGTFWFDAVNESGEIVRVREGRFDAEY